MAPEQFDLGRMVRLLESLGNPQAAYPVIHVAGTKGKGSVSAMSASVLRAAGYRVGLYTSPHLQDYSERMQINGVPISQEDLVQLVDEIKPHVESIPRLTTFEIGTALAFWYFARQSVDAAVIEVGLGGRLDATNVVVPVVSVITSLSYDHAEFLGDTLAAIAAEKAGIIKPGIPVVLAPQKDEARLVVERIARERSSELFQVGRDLLYAPVSHSLDGQTFLLWNSSEQVLVDMVIETGILEEWEPVRLTMPMLGYHQIENAATAYSALQIFRKTALAIPEAAIRQGFARVSWPGRFEILSRKPMVVADSAHNRDSALKLRLTLDDYFPGKPVILLFGASTDKDIKGMFAELMPRVEQVIATASIHPRAADPNSLVDLAHQHGKPARVVEPLEAAIQEAIRLADSNSLVLVTGSIFVAAGAAHAMRTLSSLKVE